MNDTVETPEVDGPTIQAIPVCIVVDSEGQYCVGEDRGETLEAYAENYGSEGPLQVYLLDVNCQLPEDVEAEIDAPAPDQVESPTVEPSAS